MIRRYLRALYKRTMNEAYALASDQITKALLIGGECLDCGAHKGYWYHRLNKRIGIRKDQYHGIEWNEESVRVAQNNGLNVTKGDLNKNCRLKTINLPVFSGSPYWNIF